MSILGCLDMVIDEPSLLSNIESDDKEFIIFPKLPYELQLKIWKHAAADIEPRIITFELNGGTPPALLQACHTSRKELIRTYQIRISHADYETSGFRIFLKHDVDVVFLEEANTLSPHDNGPKDSALCNTIWNYPVWLKPVERLALNVDEARNLKHMVKWEKYGCLWCRLFECCPKLRELILVCNERRGGAYKDMTEIPPDTLDVKDLTKQLERIQRRGYFTSLKLTFVKF